MSVIAFLIIAMFWQKSCFKTLVLIGIFASGIARAEDKWFCTDDQAMRSGNTLMICGVGTSYDEGDARKKALENSMNEFKTMCALSADCKGHKITVDPKRSTCFANPEKFHTSFANFTCHRMFVFTIL